MPIAFGFVVAFLNYWLLHRNTERGIMLYCVLLVVCPVSIIGSLSIYYSYISLPFLYLWYISKGSNTIKSSKYLKPLIFLWIWEVIATFIAISLGVGNGVNYFGFFGTFRNIIILSILSKQLSVRLRFITILEIVVLINCIALTVELMLLQIWSYDTVVSTWLRFYGTLGNSGSLDHLMEYGMVGRLHGTFASSAFPGTLSVIGIGCFLYSYFEKKRWRDILMIVASLYCGFCSASKRFFLGGVVIVLVTLLVRSKWKTKHENNIDYKFPIFAMVVVVAVMTIYIALNEYLSIDYYMDYLLRGDLSGSMESRFSDDRGIVNSMIPYIKQYWMTGLGEISVNGVNITDSELYVTLFKAGIIGAFCYIVFWIGIIRRLVLVKHPYAIIILSWTMFEFVISTEFSSQLGVALLSFVLSAICTSKQVYKYEYKE